VYGGRAAGDPGAIPRAQRCATRSCAVGDTIGMTGESRTESLISPASGVKTEFGTVSDSLAKGVMEIDHFFESGALYAVSQVGVKTAGLIDFEIERLDGFLGENVDAAILLGEVLGADAVAGQLASQFFGKHFGLRQCVAAPEDAPCPLIINNLERRVSLAIRAAVIRLGIHPRLLWRLLSELDGYGRRVNRNRHRAGTNLGDRLSPVVVVSPAHIPF
jgi:hypothetical protein